MKNLVLLIVIFNLSCMYSIKSSSAYSSNVEITVLRQMPAKTSIDDSVTVEIILHVGDGIVDPISGFYFTDQIPEGLIIETDSVLVTLNGTEITNIINEIGSKGEVYSDTVPFRFILERPREFTEENPLNGGDELVIIYDLIIPDDVDLPATYNFPGYNWVGRVMKNPAEDIFGYEEIENILELTESTVSTTTTTFSECLVEFIYGDDSEEVVCLRKIRDQILLRTKFGEKIIRIYYDYSFYIVNTIKESKGKLERVKEIAKNVYNYLYKVGHNLSSSFMCYKQAIS